MSNVRILAVALLALLIGTACSEDKGNKDTQPTGAAAPAQPEAAPQPEVAAQPKVAAQPEAAATPAAAAEPAAAKTSGKGPAYDVSCPAGATQAEKCQVGKETYVGWRSFHTHCFQCHGGSAMGSTFAPNLMERFNTRVDYERFNYVLHNGYTGKVGAMPSFAKNSAVLKDMDPLYSYLRARADGALPAGRPVKKP